VALALDCKAHAEDLAFFMGDSVKADKKGAKPPLVRRNELAYSMRLETMQTKTTTPMWR
jgi:hypothetical protein